jgi:hypothetical protein
VCSTAAPSCSTRKKVGFIMTRSKNNEPRRGTVIGIFRHQRDAERAIQDLKASAFADHQIAVLMQDPGSGRQLAEDSVLITVHAEGRREEAEAILANAGAEFGGRSVGATAIDHDRARTIEGGESRPEPRDEVRTGNKRRVTDRANESWRGSERRYRHDPAYPGPERRVARL